MGYRNLFLVLFSLIFIGGGIIFISKNQSEKNKPSVSNINTSKEDSTVRTSINNMKLTSSAFENNQPIPAKYTCDGQNVNPPLKISGVPENAKSIVLIMDDPDAPAGTWVHWMVWNIDPKTAEIVENSIPNGSIQGTTSFGKPSYGGPCPPSGTHHYYFNLYVLDATINNLSSLSTKEDLEKSFNGHIIDKTELIGLYSKK